MTSESTEVEVFVTPEVKANIGGEGKPFTWPEPLDRSTLRRFVQATKDQNPLYSDEEAAKRSPYGGLVAPPFYLARGAFGFREADPERRETGVVPRVEIPGLTRSVNGGNETEWFRPVYLGDTLTSKSRITDIYQRPGRSGPLVITISETVYTNQRGELVAISRQQGLRMK